MSLNKNKNKKQKQKQTEQDCLSTSSRWSRWTKPCDLAIGFCTVRMTSVNEVNEQAQWIAENYSASPTMDSHVLAMDLSYALFVRASPTGWSRGAAPHEERPKSTSGRHCLTTSWPWGERCLPATPRLLQWAMRPGPSRKRRMGNVLIAVVAWWRHAWRWSALRGCLYLDTSITKLLLFLIRWIINFYGSSK